MNKQERHIRGGLATRENVLAGIGTQDKRVTEQKALIISDINESISWDKR